MGLLLFLKAEIGENLALDMVVTLSQNSTRSTKVTLHSNQSTEA